MKSKSRYAVKTVPLKLGKKIYTKLEVKKYIM
jgi:hypothetical protein